MSYLVLARKYRPQTFTSVTGQEHVTKTLANAIRRDKVAHAFLFAGPRGVGKTSIARIFSKALNCKKGPTPEPCMECVNCLEITQGTSLAVREIDGASHNSVDNVRELIDSFRSLPAPGNRYKIYIIDEVHMLSTSAFNALLKSLEEPPPNTVFILATTEAHKIPETVISRCQRHDFRALSTEEIESRLRAIASEEKLTVEPEALRMVARVSDGSMRDAQSLFDRVQSFCDGAITAPETSRVLGTVERRMLYEMADAIVGRDAPKALELVATCFSTGLNPGLFFREFVAYWREILVAKFGGEAGLRTLGLNDEEIVELRRIAERQSTHDVHDLVQLARTGADSALRSNYPKYAFEALIVRMATREPVREIGTIVGKLREMVSHGGGARPSAASTPVSAPQPPPSASSGPPPEIHRKGAERPAPAESLARTDPAPTSDPTAPSGTEASYEWGAFVRHVQASKAIFLSEHLKRLAIDRFSDGVLEARGPEFSVGALEQSQTKEKLVAALTAFTSVAKWRISLKGGVSTAQPDPGSLQHQEEEARTQSRKQKTSEIASHPKILSLQKAFPGSKIENIKLKE